MALIHVHRTSPSRPMVSFTGLGSERSFRGRPRDFPGAHGQSPFLRHAAVLAGLLVSPPMRPKADAAARIISGGTSSILILFLGIVHLHFSISVFFGIHHQPPAATPAGQERIGRPCFGLLAYLRKHHGDTQKHYKQDQGGHIPSLLSTARNPASVQTIPRSREMCRNSASFPYLFHNRA